jgi:hypothetical protein
VDERRPTGPGPASGSASVAPATASTIANIETSLAKHGSNFGLPIALALTTLLKGGIGLARVCLIMSERTSGDYSEYCKLLEVILSLTASLDHALVRSYTFVCLTHGISAAKFGFGLAACL